jgi:HPr kinase/phosphorylase
VTEIIHGTAVLTGSAGVLVRGPSGAGKSRIASLLLARGARLVADDQVFVSACHGRLVASAPAAGAGLLEMRGRGIVQVPHEQWAVVRLVGDLVEGEMDRLPAAEELACELCGVHLPRQPLPVDPSAAALLLEVALRDAMGWAGRFPLHSA